MDYRMLPFFARGEPDGLDHLDTMGLNDGFHIQAPGSKHAKASRQTARRNSRGQYVITTIK